MRFDFRSKQSAEDIVKNGLNEEYASFLKPAKGKTRVTCKFSAYLYLLIHQFKVSLRSAVPSK